MRYMPEVIMRNVMRMNGGKQRREEPPSLSDAFVSIRTALLEDAQYQTSQSRVSKS